MARQFVQQPGLADAGDAQQRDHLRRPLLGDAAGQRDQQRQLLVAADHRRPQALDPPAAGPVEGSLGRPCRERRALALGAQLGARAVADRSAAGAHRPLADQHGARLGVLLQPGGDVDGVAGHHHLAAGRGVAAGDHLAGVDADPQRDLAAVQPADALGQVGEPALGGQCREHGALGIVLMRLGDPEHGHHRVAGELLADAAEPGDLGVDDLEQPALDVADVLGVELLAERGRAGQVGEQDRHHPALVGRGDGLAPPGAVPQPRAACWAEARSRRRLGAADGAELERRCAARAAESRPRVVLDATHLAGRHCASLPWHRCHLWHRCFIPSRLWPMMSSRVRWISPGKVGRT